MGLNVLLLDVNLTMHQKTKITRVTFQQTGIIKKYTLSL